MWGGGGWRWCLEEWRRQTPPNAPYLLVSCGESNYSRTRRRSASESAPGRPRSSRPRAARGTGPVRSRLASPRLASGVEVFDVQDKDSSNHARQALGRAAIKLVPLSFRRQPTASDRTRPTCSTMHGFFVTATRGLVRRAPGRHLGSMVRHVETRPRSSNSPPRTQHHTYHVNHPPCAQHKRFTRKRATAAPRSSSRASAAPRATRYSMRWGRRTN